LNIGYRHIDCASAYGNQDFVGKALHKFLSENKECRREDIFITSKLWNSQQDGVETACRNTLEELNLQYLDLYLIHWPIYLEQPKKENDWLKAKENHNDLYKLKYPTDSSSGLLKEKEFTIDHLKRVWRDMELLVEKGLVKRIGVSNFNIDLMKELLKTSKIKPYCNQVECHAYLQQRDMRNFLKSKNIKLIAYSPLGGGNTNFNEHPLIKQASSELNCSPTQYVLAWNLAQGNVVIPRSRQETYLKQNFQSQDLVKTIQNKDHLLNIDLGKEIRTCHPLYNSEKGEIERNLNFKF